MRSPAWITTAMLIATTAFTAGCGGSTKATGATQPEAPSSEAAPAGPTLVEIDIGVWVLRDSSSAVYYVAGNYWTQRDGAWHRSAVYDGGWTKIADTSLPVAIARRDHTQYVKYHGDAKSRTQPAPRNEELAIPERRATPPLERASSESPGVGNERKEAGEQPGTVPPPGAPGKHAKTPHGALPVKGQAARPAQPKKDAKADRKKKS